MLLHNLATFLVASRLCLLASLAHDVRGQCPVPAAAHRAPSVEGMRVSMGFEQGCPWTQYPCPLPRRDEYLVPSVHTEKRSFDFCIRSQEAGQPGLQGLGRPGDGASWPALSPVCSSPALCQEPHPTCVWALGQEPLAGSSPLVPTQEPHGDRRHPTPIHRARPCAAATAAMAPRDQNGSQHLRSHGCPGSSRSFPHPSPLIGICSSPSAVPRDL